ncbi:7963_t:CDS:1, partial [Entrophospora sp. SA101]
DLLKVEFNESILEDLNEELSLHNHVKRVLEVIVDLLIDKLGMVKPLIKK